LGPVILIIFEYLGPAVLIIYEYLWPYVFFSLLTVKDSRV